MSLATRTDPGILERTVADHAPLPGETDTLLDLCREAVAVGDTSNVREHVEREVMLGRAEVVGSVVGLILDHPRADLTAGCLALAAGLPTYTGTEVALARRFKLSKEAVCQRVQVLRRRLGLSRSRSGEQPPEKKRRPPRR